jgi:CubicO group peptidase (beta-lactamase class C family)
MIHKNLALSCLLVLFCSAAFAQSQKPWKTSTPEEQGMNSLLLANAIKQFKQDSINIHGLLVIKNNHVVLDVGFYPFKNNYVHDLASVSKSITSLLIGIAIDKQFIKNENEPVYHYFPEYHIQNDTLKAVTIKDLLNMASGWQCSWSDGEKELRQMVKSADWVKFMFSLPFDTIPGQKFSYCSGNFYLLAEILQRTTKMTCYDFANKNLFAPLGFGKSYWPQNDKHVNVGYGDLHISIYDMAKIGCLLLNNGHWNGQQIVSKQWLSKIKPLYKIHKTESYGYGWWLDSENPDEIQAMGRGGQRLFILRNAKTVIATVGGGFDAGDMDDLIPESIHGYNKNENHVSQLRQQIRVVESPDTASDNNSGDRFSFIELNKTFQLNKNDPGFTSIRFEKRGEDGFMILHFTDGAKEEHPIEMDNQYRMSAEHTFGLPMAVKSRWLNDTTLEINYNRLCRIENYRFVVSFKGNSIEVKITEPTKKINETLIGKAL